ncbi:MAG: hypothetical protein ACOVN4_01565 [Bosea sp. (in: a-proteobacteria)]
MTNPTTYLPGSQDSIGWRNAGLLAIACALATGLALTASVISALAQPSPSSWPVLPETFESTGGGGWMITQYRPVVDGAVCKTDFVTLSPDGKDTYPASVQWTAIPRNGGTYCAEGKWRTKDGSGSGATLSRFSSKMVWYGGHPEERRSATAQRGCKGSDSGDDLPVKASEAMMASGTAWVSFIDATIEPGDLCATARPGDERIDQ